MYVGPYKVAEWFENGPHELNRIITGANYEFDCRKNAGEIYLIDYESFSKFTQHFAGASIYGWWKTT